MHYSNYCCSQLSSNSAALVSVFASCCLLFYFYGPQIYCVIHTVNISYVVSMFAEEIFTSTNTQSIFQTCLNV